MQGSAVLALSHKDVSFKHLCTQYYKLYSMSILIHSFSVLTKNKIPSYCQNFTKKSCILEYNWIYFCVSLCFLTEVGKTCLFWSRSASFYSDEPISLDFPFSSVSKKFFFSSQLSVSGFVLAFIVSISLCNLKEFQIIQDIPSLGNWTFSWMADPAAWHGNSNWFILELVLFFMRV